MVISENRSTRGAANESASMVPPSLSKAALIERTGTDCFQSGGTLHYDFPLFVKNALGPKRELKSYVFYVNYI